MAEARRVGGKYFRRQDVRSRLNSFKIRLGYVKTIFTFNANQSASSALIESCVRYKAEQRQDIDAAQEKILSCRHL